ncbi:MAG: metallophosphoesterase [Anaerolineae bacterium]|nr:metallophosphoesterase [Anaerolineae bacterium]
MNLPNSSTDIPIESVLLRRLCLLSAVWICSVVLLLPGATPRVLYAEEPAYPPPDFTVAFIGDQGLGANAKAVLDLIQSEGAAMVLHQGDFDYVDNPDAWDQQINDSLGATFPYFASVGNHDLAQWTGYQQKLQARLDGIPEASCGGDLGVNSACHYQGLFFILSGVGTLGSDHETYLREQLAADDSLWTICSWHKNQHAMQVGSKPDEVGWEAYEACREAGAIIATGHEHSYSRTRTLSHIESQTIDATCDDDPNTPDADVCVSAGRTFVFVSGIAGIGIRNQDRCLPATTPYGCAGEWAKIYASDQGAQYGALFITFHVDGDPKKARAYFKNIDGEVIDSFTITATNALTYHTFVPIVIR